MADFTPPPADWLHALIGVKSAHAVAGIFGGLVRGLVSRGFSWTQRISSAVVGAAVAGYGTPLIAPLARDWHGTWTSPPGDIEGSVGFALGLVGMTLCDALIRWARRWRDGPPPPFPPPKAGASS
jgi:hypothetical protein